MALETLPPVSLPREAVPVPELGGEVIVQGLLLSQRLELHALQRALAEPRPGEDADQARARAGAQLVPRLLALTVVAPGGAPLWPVAQWEAFGAVHYVAALALFDVAMRLSGMSIPAAEAP